MQLRVELQKITEITYLEANTPQRKNKRAIGVSKAKRHGET